MFQRHVSQIIISCVNEWCSSLWNASTNMEAKHLGCYTFHFNSFDVHARHAPTNHQIIWSTSYHHMTVLVRWSWPHLLFIVASVHRRQVLLKLHRHTRSLASKPPTCPSHLQPVRWAKSCPDLLHLDHMTTCHVSYAMSSSIITCASFATSSSQFHLHGICCSHTCTCRLITYVSPIKHN
jgi:hypothetical protein